MKLLVSAGIGGSMEKRKLKLDPVTGFVIPAETNTLPPNKSFNAGDYINSLAPGQGQSTLTNTAESFKQLKSKLQPDPGEAFQALKSIDPESSVREGEIQKSPPQWAYDEGAVFDEDQDKQLAEINDRLDQFGDTHNPEVDTLLNKYDELYDTFRNENKRKLGK